MTCAILFAFAAAASAQEYDFTNLELERLMKIEVDEVNGASRYLQKISEAPASITVVTAEEIRAFGYRTLTDVLAGVRGFYVTDDRNYSYFGTRGLVVPGDYNSRMLVLVDGHRINDNVYEQVLAGTEFPVDIALIARIEVIRGPGSVMYGANAFSAVINVITRRGSRVGGTEVALDAGTLGTGQARATYGNRYANGAEVLVSASGYYSRGDKSLYFPAFDSPDTHNGIAENADSDRAQRLFASVSVGNFVLNAAHGGRRKQIPTASFGTVFDDNREDSYDGRGFAELQYGRQIGLSGDLLARVYYDAERYEGHYPMPREDGSPAVVSTDMGVGDAVGSELTLSRAIGSRHRLLVGSEYIFNLRQNLYTFDAEPFQQYLDERHHSTIWSLNVQDEIRLHRRVLATGAIRYSHHSLFTGRVVPRAALVVGPFRRTTFKVLYAEAFRTPSANDLYYDTPLTQYGNSALKPESVRSFEFVSEHTLNSAVSVTASAFRTNLNGIIVKDAPAADENYSNGQALVDGVEFGARVTPRPGFSGDLSYSYQHPADLETTERLRDSPRHLGKLAVMTPLATPRVRAGVQLLYTGTIHTRTEDLAPSVVTNLTISTWNLGFHFDVTSSVFNLFDTHASYPVSPEHVQGSVPQYGRRFLTRLTWRF